MFLALQVVLTLVALLGIPFAVAGHEWKGWLWRSLAATLVAHVIMDALLIFGVGSHDIYTRGAYSAHFLMKYAAGWALITLVLTLVLAALDGRLQLERETGRWRWWDVLVALAGSLLVGLAGVLYFVPRWFSTYFGRLSGDQFLFLIQDGGGESTADVANQILHYMVIPGVTCFVAGAAIVLWRRAILFRRSESSPTRRIPAGGGRLILIMLSVAGLVFSTFYATAHLPLREIVRAQTTTSEYFEHNYVDPASTTLTFPGKKRNLIHIYMESVENSYFDREHGGYMDQNLMPELGELINEGVSFSNTDRFGGPHQTFGAVHSVAAMINMWSGVPMKNEPFGGKNEMTYPDFTTIGDILHDNGYATEFMLSTRAAWGNVGTYYQQHGDFTVKGPEWAKEQGLIPPDYNVWWGFEDDKLYEWAKPALTELAKGDKPFYFILENTDTHFPDGYVSPLMKDAPFDKQYSNVIHYSQGEVVKFVRWIQAQPFYANTTIVITGDHQSMDKNFFAGWDPSYERTVVNVILNPAVPAPGKERTTNRDYAPFDFFPTILSATGVKIDGERLGLGTNLFSNQSTLVERDGLDTVNDELSQVSDFYREHM